MKLLGFERLNNDMIHIAVELDGGVIEMTYNETDDLLSIHSNGEAFTMKNYTDVMEILKSKEINLPF